MKKWHAKLLMIAVICQYCHISLLSLCFCSLCCTRGILLLPRLLWLPSHAQYISFTSQEYCMDFNEIHER